MAREKFRRCTARCRTGAHLLFRRSRSRPIGSSAITKSIVDVAAQQAKAAQLKAGDQLLEANGVVVHSAYEFTATTFPGGWLEVLRGGKRVRIEGFEAGPLGIALEDRAAINP